MDCSTQGISRLIDASIVRAEVDADELKRFADMVRRYRFIGAHVMPCYVSELRGMLEGCDDVLIGTGIGFPFGTSKTEVKVYEARLALADGCRELDMVINIGALRSGQYDYVKDDIRAVVEAAEGKTVKVILEVHYLSDDDIRHGCECVINAGAHFVKTATGNAPSGASPENIALMKSVVGERIQIKAAGGVSSLAILKDLYSLGARRFGISMRNVLGIIRECESVVDK